VLFFEVPSCRQREGPYAVQGVEGKNPSDADHAAPSLKRHMKAFGHAPQLYGADCGFVSEQNLASCARSGVST